MCRHGTNIILLHPQSVPNRGVATSVQDLLLCAGEEGQGRDTLSPGLPGQTVSRLFKEKEAKQLGRVGPEEVLTGCDMGRSGRTRR